MYDVRLITVKTFVGITEGFSAKVKLHQGSEFRNQYVPLCYCEEQVDRWYSKKSPGI